MLLSKDDYRRFKVWVFTTSGFVSGDLLISLLLYEKKKFSVPTTIAIETRRECFPLFRSHVSGLIFLAQMGESRVDS